MPQLADEPLSPTDRALLRGCLHHAQVQRRVLLGMAAPLALCGLGLGGYAFVRLPPVEFWAAMVVAGLCLSGAGALAWLARRMRRRAGQPALAALARGRKTVATGQLQEVQAQDIRPLRYRLDGELFELHVPLAASGDSRALAVGRLLQAVEHLPPGPVALHWVAAGEGLRWLLQAHALDAEAARQAVRPAEPADQRTAGRSVRRLLLFTTVLSLALAAFFAWLTGFDPQEMRVIAVSMASLWVLIAVIAVLPTLLHAQRQTHVRLLQGPVTEVLRGRLPQGKYMVDAHWVRVGGVAHCALGFDADVRPGDTVRLEWLTRAQALPGEGVLIRLARIAPGP